MPRPWPATFCRPTDGIVRPPKCVVVDDEFDWQGDRHLRRGLDETVIYEMHVRGFTCARSSGVSHPGTYLGLIEKIPYLQSLGVTAVELMPVFEFPHQRLPRPACERPNYWGYDPLAFFAPHRGYAVGGEPGCQVREFKEMVLALHRAGIEVILDVVFNHTAEGNENGPTLSFKGLENRVYYMLENGGGTLSQLLRLRQHAQRQPPDRPRDDLPLPPLLGPQLPRRRLPLRSGVDPQPQPRRRTGAQSAGASSRSPKTRCWPTPRSSPRRGTPPAAYQVGTFGSLRWAEWNGHYRDDLRRFWRGDPNMVGLLATRLAGSSDLYQASGRRPYHSINFITSHDGFTLNDLVSYSEKHNEANGENNRDGEKNNFSYNYGVEGPTRRAAVEAVRLRQIKNMLASLLLSQGVPMLLAGDECRRTQAATTTPTARTTRFPGSIGSWSRSTRACGGSAGAGGLSQGRADRAADRFPPRPAAPPRRAARRELVRPQRRAGGLVGRFAEPGLPAGGRAARRPRRRRRTITC